jgi:internalin A
LRLAKEAKYNWTSRYAEAKQMIAARQMKIAFTVIVGYLATSCSIGLSQTSREYKTFAQWCENLSQLSTEQKHTVEVLLKEVGTRECNAASQKLTELTELRLLVKGIADIKPLSNLTNLTKLQLSGNPISDLKPLSNLTNLTKLGLSHHQIADLKPLSNLTNLTELYLSSSPISDLKPLSNLTNLNKLVLSHHQIADLKPLSNLTNLTKLDLSNNQIADLKALSNLTNLTELYLLGKPLANRTCPLQPASICRWEINKTN